MRTNNNQNKEKYMSEKKSFLELVSAVPTTETKDIKLDRFPTIEWRFRAIGIEELKQLCKQLEIL